jgi:hypothetical protein
MKIPTGNLASDRLPIDHFHKITYLKRNRTLPIDAVPYQPAEAPLFHVRAPRRKVARWASRLREGIEEVQVGMLAGKRGYAGLQVDLKGPTPHLPKDGPPAEAVEDVVVVDRAALHIVIARSARYTPIPPHTDSYGRNIQCHPTPRTE